MTQADLERKRDMLIAALGPVGCPKSARKLATWLGVHGARETRRRRVREVVDFAREQHGDRICADAQTGYWKARSSAEWEEYKASRRGGARFAFVKVRRFAEAATDAGNCQETLPGFEPLVQQMAGFA